MKVLLTGANGYVGRTLLPFLVESGHQVYALVRDQNKLSLSEHLRKSVEIIEADLLDPKSLEAIPEQIDVGYYLVHSMRQSRHDFVTLEERCISNLVGRLKETRLKRIIYLSGLSRGEALSKHMRSRQNVERIIEESGLGYTIFRSGIVLGSGSASLAIIRDLVEKLPVMVAPRWVNQRTQPIAIYDVVYYLSQALDHDGCKNRRFEIGGPDILTYKELLELQAQIRGLKRWILTVPVLTPRLSSYWLYFVTETSFSLAASLVDSMRADATVSDDSINGVIPHECLSCQEALDRASGKFRESVVIPLWEEGFDTSCLADHLQADIQPPADGCFIDRQKAVSSFSVARDSVFSLGSTKRWYYWRFAWRLRAFMDRLLAGKSFNYGKREENTLTCGDSVDFWEVLYANQRLGRLILYAKMKLPGEAWLSYEIKDNILYQTATFRPKGWLGRLYWFFLIPAHYFIFRGQVKRLSGQIVSPQSPS